MPKTILVVDDEPTLRETMAEAMVLDGHRVVTAGSGTEALARFRDGSPDLVLLDLTLSEPPAVEVCRAIRAESSVPILVLATKGSQVDRDLGLEAGADDHVTKPFRLRELSARVRALLQRSEVPSPEWSDGSVDLGEVRADLAGRRLLRGSQVVPLKPRAFELLAFFVLNPGRVFTREQLLEQVWGPAYAVETRTVDVHVHWLRQRIEEDPTHPTLLQTVRGVGYVFRRSS